jgi:chromosomal replication initiator protein DnaA
MALAGGYDFPKGVTTKSTAGGAEVIRKLLVGLKRFSFTGYVKTTLETDGSTRSGYIVIKDGTPVFALHQVATAEGVQGEHGQMALRRAWEDSYNPRTILDVHGGVPIESIIVAHPEGKIDSTQAVPKQRVVVGLKWGQGAQGELDALKAKIEHYRSEGYAVEDLEAALERGAADSKTAMSHFESNLTKQKMLADILDSIRAPELEEEVSRARARFRDPMRIVATEAAVQQIRDKAEHLEKTRSDIVDVKGQTRSARPDVIRDGDFRCQICHFPVTPGQPCQRCGAEPGAKLPAFTGAPARELPREETNLDPSLTFENFVVGESNRFAHAAGTAMASMRQEAYNPLFIWSGTGLGKTHVLNAIGNKVSADHPDKKVLYVGAQKFVKEMLDALQHGEMEAFRDRYRSLDLLLLDDVHFLAQSEAQQDEMFNIFNELKGRNGYIVLTSDRPPKEIKGMAERLVSRFSSGLVTDIQAPEIETRIAILRRKAEEKKLDLDDEALMHIATRFTSNIRNLEGALTKVSAYSSLLGAEVTLDTVKEVLKDDGQASLAAPTEAKAAVAPTAQSASLKPAHSYLVEEERPERCFELFAEYAKQGYAGLAITRTNPTRVKESHELGDAVQVIWLTDREGGDGERIAPVLERLIYKIEEHLGTDNKGIVLLDGIEYLVSSNNFESVLKFLRRLIDDVSESRSIFMMSLTPGTLGDKEQKILKREMELVSG